MMENKLYRRVFLYTLGIALGAAGVTLMLTQNHLMALGFVLGAIARLAGFQQIIRMGNRIEQSERPKATASSNYVVRYIFYGIVIWLSITRGVNVLTLLFGFLSMNVAIFLITYLESRKGSE